MYTDKSFFYLCDIILFVIHYRFKLKLIDKNRSIRTVQPNSTLVNSFKNFLQLFRMYRTYVQHSFLECIECIERFANFQSIHLISICPSRKYLLSIHMSCLVCSTNIFQYHVLYALRHKNLCHTLNKNFELDGPSSFIKGMCGHYKIRLEIRPTF